MGSDSGLPDPNFWVNLWDLAKTAGPFGTTLMLVMWFLERQERLRVRTLYDGLLERSLTTIVTVTSSIEKLSELLSRKRT